MKTMIALLLGLAAASPLAAQDTIKFKDPKKNADIEGEIVTLTFDLVEIEVPAGNDKVKQAVNPRKIAELIPRNNFDFLKGQAALANEDYAAAIGRFERVLADDRLGALVQQQAEVMIVRCQLSAENYPGVVEAAQALRKRRPDGFFVGESLALEAKALLAMKDQAGAKAAIAALNAQGKAHAIPDWVKSADLLDAALAERQKNWRIALATYRKYSRDSEAAAEAALGELRCLTAIPDFPALSVRAEGIFKEAAGNETFSPRLLIAAYTARADVALQGGKVRAALFDYLQGGLTLAKGGKSPEHETSLARCALTCVRVASESDRGEKATFRSRAVEMLRELSAAYPASRYRVEIEEALRALR